MLSYKIIESHQGTISIMSEVGIGTTVTIYLPKVLSKQSLSNCDDKCIAIRTSSNFKSLYPITKRLVKTKLLLLGILYLI